jgi:membrane-associated phospholipid phosphatase
VALSVGLVVAFLLLGQAAQRGRPYGWDTSASGFLQRHEKATQDSAADRIPDLIVDWGGAATFAAGFLVLAIVVVLRRTRQLLFLLAAGAAVLILTPLLKEQFEGPSPDYSYPSGHASRSAAVAAAAILIAWSTRLRWPTLVLGVVGTGALGLALVYENWHPLSDVLGGWCLGFACAGAAWLAVAAWQRRER